MPLNIYLVKLRVHGMGKLETEHVHCAEFSPMSWIIHSSRAFLYIVLSTVYYQAFSFSFT